MKKIAIALSALLAVAGITGCGQKNESPEAESKAPASAKLKIGVSLPAADHGWSGGIISAAELAKKEVEAENADVEVLLTIGKDATSTTSSPAASTRSSSSARSPAPSRRPVSARMTRASTRSSSRTR